MANTASTDADVFDTIKILSANKEMSAAQQTGRCVTFDPNQTHELRNSGNKSEIAQQVEIVLHSLFLNVPNRFKKNIS